MADNGENDDTVLHASSFDQNKEWKWTNPLTVRDTGADDDRILTQTDGSQMVIRSTKIGDHNGDGVIDVVPVSRQQMDAYFDPAVYGVVEDIYNTRHTYFPGHQRKPDDYEEPAFKDPWASRE